ncbi:MAG: dihydropyrimidinase [Parvibaculaceae bacterium]
MHDLVVRGGRVALDEGWRDCDIGIDRGRIAGLGANLAGAGTLDARGLWVLPGGIDAHCHLDQPSWGGAVTADDYRSGTISAAFGGTSCIVPFGMPGPGTTTVQGVERSLDRARDKAVIDFSLHGVVTEATGGVADQLRELAARGMPSVKLFMTYEGFAVSDERILAAMDAARANGMVVMVHAENDAIIRRTRQRLADSGRTDLRYHTLAHAEVAEREAVNRATALAEVTGARLVVVHLSSAATAAELARARARGTDVIGETCPQYLFLSAADLGRAPGDAARFMVSPPPRQAGHGDGLWPMLSDGGIALWSSDHSPYRLADKLRDPARPDFTTAVSGIPGLETRLPLLFSEGLLAGRVPLARYLDLAGGAAARLYGLDHAKGRIAHGLDADLALWDPARRWQIRREDLHSEVDFTSYEGRWLTGKPVSLLLRGRPVIRDGALLADPPAGRFVARRAADPSTFNTPIEETTPWLAP